DRADQRQRHGQEQVERVAERVELARDREVVQQQRQRERDRAVEDQVVEEVEGALGLLAHRVVDHARLQEALACLRLGDREAEARGDVGGDLGAVLLLQAADRAGRLAGLEAAEGAQRQVAAQRRGLYRQAEELLLGG